MFKSEGKNTSSYVVLPLRESNTVEGEGKVVPWGVADGGGNRGFVCGVKWHGPQTNTSEA